MTAVHGLRVQSPIHPEAIAIGGEWVDFSNQAGWLCGRIRIQGDGRPFYGDSYSWRYTPNARTGGVLGPVWQEWPAWVDDLLAEWPFLRELCPSPHCRSAQST